MSETVRSGGMGIVGKYEQAFSPEICLTRLGCDARLLSEMGVIFNRVSGDHCNALKVALKNGDFDAVVRFAHLIKGSAASFFSEGLVALAQITEDAGRKKEIDAARSVGPELFFAVGCLQEQIALFIAANEASPKR